MLQCYSRVGLPPDVDAIASAMIRKGGIARPFRGGVPNCSFPTKSALTARHTVLPAALHLARQPGGRRPSPAEIEFV